MTWDYASCKITIDNKHGGDIMKTVTLSAFRPNYSMAENNDRQSRLIAKMLAVGFTLVSKNVGSYKGERELSATFTHDRFDTKQALLVASFFEQESILIDDSGKGYLVFCENASTFELGQRAPIDERYAENYDAWTMTQNGDFFTYL